LFGAEEENHGTQRTADLRCRFEMNTSWVLVTFTETELTSVVEMVTMLADTGSGIIRGWMEHEYKDHNEKRQERLISPTKAKY